MFLSISFTKKVLPLWMLSMLDRYSTISAKYGRMVFYMCYTT